MDKRIYELHAGLCKIFTSPKRLEIIDLLQDGERTVNELAGVAEIPQANVSQHLTVLRERGIVKTRREGTNVYYRIANPKILKACAIIREVLSEQFKEREKLAKIVKEAG